MKKYDTFEYLEQAKKVHGKRYDYSETIYTDSQTRIAIKCKIHGEFSVMPSNHLSGVGCSKCAKGKYTRETYIGKAVEVHGDKYLQELGYRVISIWEYDYREKLKMCRNTPRRVRLYVEE